MRVFACVRAGLHSLPAPVSWVADLSISGGAMDVWFFAIIPGVSEGDWRFSVSYSCMLITYYRIIYLVYSDSLFDIHCSLASALVYLDFANNSLVRGGWLAVVLVQSCCVIHRVQSR